MSARVTELSAIVVQHGISGGNYPAFAAWCPECMVGESGVNWHGTVHVVGFESAPNMSAILDAGAHNDEHHPLPVHNHGAEDGLGLSCPERLTAGGQLRGACLPDTESDDSGSP